MNVRHRLISLVTATLALAGVARGQSPTTAPVAAPPAEAKMAVFLLVGQSNMAGRGKVEAEDVEVDPFVWKLDQADAWVPATDPLHFDKPKVAGVGLGRTFGKLVAAREPGTHVGLVPCAVGGTSINQWGPNGKLYPEAIRRAKVALKHGTLRGILWHQGESDSSPEKQSSYEEKLKALIARFRADLDAPDAPFVLGEIGRFHVAKQPAGVQFNEMVRQFVTANPNVACVSSEGLTDNGDNTHFDAESQREFGRRYAAAYFKLVDAAK